ncbi:hypothetical protein HK102_012391 [Quaeritorhiza haematococci]|nr:hypothetical protein HK102_012391 [Quaeritorhiza haematococci]
MTKQAIGATNQSSAQEMETLERDIQRMKIEMQGSLTASQQRAQKITIEYDNLAQRYQDTREGQVKQLVKALEELVSFKQHVSESLAELHKMALEEYELVIATPSIVNVDAGSTHGAMDFEGRYTGVDENSPMLAIGEGSAAAGMVGMIAKAQLNGGMMTANSVSSSVSAPLQPRQIEPPQQRQPQAPSQQPAVQKLGKRELRTRTRTKSGGGGGAGDGVMGSVGGVAAGSGDNSNMKERMERRKSTRNMTSENGLGMEIVTFFLDL